MVTSTPFVAVTLKTESESEFKVNGQILKNYLGGSIKEVDPDFRKGTRELLKLRHSMACV